MIMLFLILAFCLFCIITLCTLSIVFCPNLEEAKTNQEQTRERFQARASNPSKSTKLIEVDEKTWFENENGTLSINENGNYTFWIPKKTEKQGE